MDRLTRKELKKDKFAQEVGHTVEFLEQNRRKITIFGAAAVGLILIVAVGFYYVRTQRAARQSALRAALDTVEAPIGSVAPGVLSFSTQADKDAAINRAWSDLTSKYSGSEEAAIAEYYLGTAAVGQGRLEEAVTRLSKVVSSGKKEPASVASLALAQVYNSQGKTAEAEKLLRALVDSPTVMVPKAEATMALARLLAPGKPDEARKLLEPLRSSPGATGRAAIAAYGELFAKR